MGVDRGKAERNVNAFSRQSTEKRRLERPKLCRVKWYCTLVVLSLHRELGSLRSTVSTCLR